MKSAQKGLFVGPVVSAQRKPNESGGECLKATAPKALCWTRDAGLGLLGVSPSSLALSIPP